MKTLATELDPFGVHANAICPGAVDGPRMDGVCEHEVKAKGMTRDEVYAGYARGSLLQSVVEAQIEYQDPELWGGDLLRRSFETGRTPARD